MGQSRLEHVAVGANNVPGSSDWGANGLVAFGASSFVAIYRPGGRILATLRGHTGRVNCVKWIPNTTSSPSNPSYLASAATDGVVRIWRISPFSLNDDELTCEFVQSLTGHTEPVVSLAVLSAANGLSNGDDTCLVSTSTDGTIRIWGHNEGEKNSSTDNHSEILGRFIERQVIDFKTKYALSTSLCCLPNGECTEILAIGCVDSKIHFFTRQNTNSGTPIMFQSKLNLTGHKDWIRALSFSPPLVSSDNQGQSDLLLASASQDNSVRLWRFSLVTDSSDLTDKSSLAGPMNADSKPAILQIRAKRELIRLDGFMYEARKESVLIAHDEWVYSVQWQPVQSDPKSVTNSGQAQTYNRMCLLTSSMDKTLVIWRPSLDHQVWVNEVCVGELAGGMFGFVGGHWGPMGDEIMSHGCLGAFQRWSHEPDENCEKGGRGGRWSPKISLTGHYQAVNDITWEPEGQYLLSVSADQTTRLLGKVPNTGMWNEIARPQIHGYDMQCGVFVSRLQYASGAEEKVIRVFDGPKTFIQTWEALGKSVFDKDLVASRPIGASAPALGLSNKSMFLDTLESEHASSANDNFTDENPPTFTYQPERALDEPPHETYLSRNTLWPETQKLYGHGYDIFSLATNHKGTLLVSACKATTNEHALMRVWDTKTWGELYTLPGHTLTVTQMQFSPNDQYLLSVSRDRGWCLYDIRDGNQYELIVKNPKAHDRIIWGCSWSHDNTFFATVARDKALKFWAVPNKENSEASTSTARTSPLSVMKFTESVTAVDMAPIKTAKGQYIVAVGLDSGAVHVLIGGTSESEWMDMGVIPAAHWHAGTVKRVKWQPHPRDNQLVLATCGVDHSVRILTCDLAQLI